LSQAEAENQDFVIISMTDLTVKHLTRREWDELAPQFLDLSYRQGGSYAETAAENANALSEFMAIIRAGTPVGLSNVRIKQIPLLPFGIAYVHHGPLSRRRSEDPADLFGECLDALRQEYVERRSLMLRVVPPTIAGPLSAAARVTCLQARGFLQSQYQESQETFVLDLRPSLPEIRRTFDAKWRSDLLKSEKSNLKITKSTELADFDHFEPMLLNLMREKDFLSGRDTAFFRRVQARAKAYERMVVHLAWHADELVAGHIGSFAGDTAVYLLGASTSKGRDLRASYLLQWAVIEHAKLVGNRYYDLGGINQTANPNVYRFKKRLNGEHVIEVGPYDLAPGPLTRGIFRLGEYAHSALSHLRAN
jgi:hypothetical protein